MGYRYSNHIEFQNVLQSGLAFSTGPIAIRGAYTLDGDTITNIRNFLINSIDIHWGKAYLPNFDATINTTGDLLSLIDNIPQYTRNIIGDDLNDLQEQISEKISEQEALNTFAKISDLNDLINLDLSEYAKLEDIPSSLSSFSDAKNYATKIWVYENITPLAGKSAYDIAVDNGFSGSQSEWLETLQGPQGIAGPPGQRGMSAYEVAINNGSFNGTINEWLESLKGQKGDPGKGTIIKGSLPTLNELNTTYPNGDGNNAYVIDGYLYGWDNETSTWTPLFQIKGEKGNDGKNGEGTIIKGIYSSLYDLTSMFPNGDGNNAYVIDGYLYVWDVDESLWKSLFKIKGEDGSNGESIYEIDLKYNYFDGTEQEWLEHWKELLKGEQGEKGEPGKDGRGLNISGAYDTIEELTEEHPLQTDADEVYLVDGYLTRWNSTLLKWEQTNYRIIGEPGKDGLSAYQLAVVNGFEGNLNDWLDSLKGEDGKNAYQLALDNGFSGSQQEWLDSLKADAVNAEEVQEIVNGIIEDSLSDIDDKIQQKIDELDTNNFATKTDLENYVTISGSTNFVTPENAETKLATLLEKYQVSGTYLTKDEGDEYYQPKGDYLTGASLENYVTSGALNTLLEKYQVSGTYLTKDEGDEYYQPKGDYLTGASLENYVTSGTLKTLLEKYQVSGTYLTKDEGDEYYQPKGDYLTGASEGDEYYQPKGDYLTGASLENYVTSGALNALLEKYVLSGSVYTITQSDNRYLTGSALNGYATESYVTSKINEIQVSGGGGEINIIEEISVNNTTINPINKKVNIDIPTKLSDLQNDIFIWRTIN